MRTSKNQLTILRLLTKPNWNTNNQWGSRAIAEETGIQLSSVNRTLAKMVRENQVIKTLHSVKEFKQLPRNYYTYRLVGHDYSDMDIEFIFSRLHLESHPTFFGDMQTNKSEAQTAIDKIAAISVSHCYIKILEDYIPTAPDKGFWDWGLELVRNYLKDLEEFGMVAFETRARLKGQHGGGDTISSLELVALMSC